MALAWEQGQPPLSSSNLKVRPIEEDQNHFGKDQSMKVEAEDKMVAPSISNNSRETTISQLILVKRAPKARDKNNNTIITNSINKSLRIAKCTTTHKQISSQLSTQQRMSSRIVITGEATISIAKSTTSLSSRHTKLVMKTVANNKTTIKTIPTQDRAEVVDKTIITIADSSLFRGLTMTIKINLRNKGAKPKQNSLSTNCRRFKDSRHQKLMKHSRRNYDRIMRPSICKVLFQVKKAKKNLHHPLTR